VLPTDEKLRLLRLENLCDIFALIEPMEKFSRAGIASGPKAFRDSKHISLFDG